MRIIPWRIKGPRLQPGLFSKAINFGGSSPQAPGTLGHIPTQARTKSETGNQGAFEYGPAKHVTGIERIIH